jgi:hypothetical protein
VAQGAECADEHSTQRCRSGQTGRSRNACIGVLARPASTGSSALPRLFRPAGPAVPAGPAWSGANSGAKYGNNVEFPTRGSAEAVGRLLAKIAHAYAVAEIGLDRFNHIFSASSATKTPIFYIISSAALPRRR